MADDNKDPLNILNDLAQDSVRVPPGGFLGGLLAGYVVGKLRGSVVVGVLLGTVTGVYVAQTFQVPNIESTVKDYLDKLKKGPK